jgi:cell division protein FtsB
MSYLLMKDINQLEKEIIKLKQENLKLLKTIQDYKDLIEEYKKNMFKIPDDSDGEASDYYD